MVQAYQGEHNRKGVLAYLEIFHAENRCACIDVRRSPQVLAESAVLVVALFYDFVVRAVGCGNEGGCALGGGLPMAKGQGMSHLTSRSIYEPEVLHEQ